MGKVVTLNLTTVTESNVTKETLPTARFQWDGFLSFKPVVEKGKEHGGSCSKYELLTVATSESFHVIKSNDVFNLTIIVRHLLFKGDDEDTSVFCEIVDNATMITIENQGKDCFVSFF